jgi:hypothetical protein
MVGMIFQEIAAPLNPGINGTQGTRRPKLELQQSKHEG